MNELIPKINMVKTTCKDVGLDLLIYCIYRSPEDQARCYRKSRSFTHIKRKANNLRDRGLGFLADILINVGPVYGQIGKHITNAGPGESWHQYLCAWDAVPKKHGKLLWDFGKHYREWEAYREAFMSAGMFPGPVGDYPHAQLYRGGNPLDVFTVEQILEKIKKKEN
jgi:peptidoglycan L-alanyl-D-glutamate endopeptidase CwlK